MTALDTIAATSSASNSTTEKVVRRFQNITGNSSTYTLIWLDDDINITQHSLEIQRKLQDVTSNFHAFDDCDTCIDYLTDAASHRLLFIISERCGPRIVPIIHDFQQLKIVYVYCTNVEANRQWSQHFNKVDGLFTNIEDLIQKMKRDQYIRERTDIDSVVMNIYSKQTGRNASEERDKKNNEFMFFQILVDILLKMAVDQNLITKQDLPRHFKRIYEGNLADERIMKEFEQQYRPEKSIWWYTRPTFFYETINKALRESDYEVLLALRFFIKDLYEQIKHEHQNFLYSVPLTNPILRVYRGQAIAVSELNFIRNNTGHFLSLQSFLSTSVDRETAAFFARASNTPADDVTRIVFEFMIDIRASNTKPFANITHLSYLRDEEEVLIMLGAIFRIEQIEYRYDENLWIGVLSLCSEDDYELKDLMKQVRKEIVYDVTSFGWLLYRKGEYQKSKEYLHGILSEATTNDRVKTNCYRGLGAIADAVGDYDEALVCYQNELDIKMKLGDQVMIAITYTDIGAMYSRKKEFDLALSYIQKALEILLPLNHPDVSPAYLAIANIHDRTNDFKTAIEYYEKAIQVTRQHFPSNYTAFGTIYGNMGVTYLRQIDVDKALDCFLRAREIWLKSMPSTHPSVLNLEYKIRRLIDLCKLRSKT